MTNLGVIDLGTNTFHLLIAKVTDDGIEEIYRERIFVQLAQDGIQKIGEAPFKRALDALRHYAQILKKHKVLTVKAFGTAALRTASNGKELVEKIAIQTGIQIELISGAKEAQLIYKGVQQAVPLEASNSLIMDIGGGSVEFIIANKEGVLWAKSFPIGVAVLFNRFHKNDPVTALEIKELRSFLRQEIAELQKVLHVHPSHHLIGASGTFDVLEKVLTIDRKTSIHSIVATPEFKPFYDKILFSTHQERLDLASIPNSRAQLIIVALVLIDTIIDLCQIQQISISAYAMKEGMLSQMHQKNG